MNIKTYKLQCDRCGLEHQVDIDFDSLSEQQKLGRVPVFENFICDRMATMYKVVNFGFDATANTFNVPQIKEQVELHLKSIYGENDFENKLKRLKKLNFVFIGGPEEYFDLISQIKFSYCMGLFYPTITAAGALGERILNELILRTRDYYKSSPHYKRVYKKKSFDNWEEVSDILLEWQIITDSVKSLFLDLNTIRNDAIHYNKNYDFESNAYNAVVNLMKIIEKQFSYFERKDICWVFDCPGEILVKSEKLNDPFVIEFVLPHCVLISAFDEPTNKPPLKAKNVPLKPLQDIEFIELRKSRNRVE